MGWYVEMHAVLAADPTPDNTHLARSLDGEDDEQTYRTACALAGMVGIDLADGGRAAAPGRRPPAVAGGPPAGRPAGR